MYDNKVLINLYVLSLGKNYELFLPVNEKIGNVSKLLNTTLFNSINPDKNYILINIDNGWVYKNNDIIRNTDIRNGTRLILV